MPVLSLHDSHPIVFSGAYHGNRHQVVMKISCIQQRASGWATFLPLHKKMKIKFPSKCLLTYILIPLLSSLFLPCARAALVLDKETGKKWNCLILIGYRSVILSVTVHCLFLIEGVIKRDTFEPKRKYCYIPVFCRGAQSTVILSFVSSAAFFPFTL